MGGNQRCVKGYISVVKDKVKKSFDNLHLIAFKVSFQKGALGRTCKGIDTGVVVIKRKLEQLFNFSPVPGQRPCGRRAFPEAR